MPYPKKTKWDPKKGMIIIWCYIWGHFLFFLGGWHPPGTKKWSSVAIFWVLQNNFDFGIETSFCSKIVELVLIIYGSTHFVVWKLALQISTNYLTKLWALVHFCQAWIQYFQVIIFPFSGTIFFGTKKWVLAARGVTTVMDPRGRSWKFLINQNMVIRADVSRICGHPFG